MIRVAMLAYPMALVILAFGAKGGGGARRLIEARAISPETARRPDSVGIKGGRETLARAVSKGLVVESGDGRFYANMDAYARRNKRLVTAFVAVALAGAAIILLLWAPWATTD